MNWLYKSGLVIAVLVALAGLALGVLSFLLPGDAVVTLPTAIILFVTGAFVFGINYYFYNMFKGFPQPKSFSESFRDGASSMSSAANMLKQMNLANKLSSTGKPVKVKVLSIRDTGQLINYDPVLEFNLEVLHERRYDNYSINNHKQVVSKIIASRILTGNEYSARVDPVDKNSIYISWL